MSRKKKHDTSQPAALTLDQINAFPATPPKSGKTVPSKGGWSRPGPIRSGDTTPEVSAVSDIATLTLAMEKKDLMFGILCHCSHKYFFFSPYFG